MKFLQLITFVFVATSLTAQTFQFVPTVTERNDVHTRVDTDAEFPGGHKELMHFFAKNLQYPELCILLGDISKMYLRFTIEKDGTVSLVQIRIKNDQDCLKEMEPQLKEWVTLMPKWIPAVLNSEPVACYYNLPMNIHPK